MSRLCSSRFERAARKLGWTRIAGLDEAGRGALFGPVVAAAVIPSAALSASTIRKS
jgi:ribonuclease HII